MPAYLHYRELTFALLVLQGDMLAWLLSTALAHDSAHSHKVLLKARARDNLIVATMELRQRAIALHLHFPWKFTLSSRGPVADVYAVWRKVINKVEAVSGNHCHVYESDVCFCHTELITSTAHMAESFCYGGVIMLNSSPAWKVHMAGASGVVV